MFIITVIIYFQYILTSYQQRIDLLFQQSSCLQLSFLFNTLYISMILSNSFSPSRYSKQPYNYQANLIGNIKINQLVNKIEFALQTCAVCNLRKKNHYCIQKQCKKRELICPDCDIKHINNRHYLHDYSYIIPFLTKDIFNNFFKLKKKVVNFHQDVLAEIKKIQDYLQELYKVQIIARKQVLLFEQQEQKGKITSFLEKARDFMSSPQNNSKLNNIFDNVLFLSVQQCLSTQEDIKNQLIRTLDQLKWPKDPQKVLKEKLKPMVDEERRQIFISSKKALQINQIDLSFRTNYQFLTDNLKNHTVQIKLESDLLGKPKFYQSFIYHFRNCSKLSIENGNVNHLRTPLTFRNLRSFEFNFNQEAEPQNIKLQNCADQLREITMRRFREEDIKLLKHITSANPQIKKIHLQFYNKIDLYNFKDLVDFLKLQKANNLVSFTLKIRTESQVKRLYGYLSKFYREPAEVLGNLNAALIQLIETKPLITKLIIEGVKPLQMPIIVSKMKKLSFLMDYKVYYQNIDLMTEIQDKQAKNLQNICYKRKRIFYALAKASKQKRLSKSTIDLIVSDYLI